MTSLDHNELIKYLNGNYSIYVAVVSFLDLNMEIYMKDGNIHERRVGRKITVRGFLHLPE